MSGSAVPVRLEVVIVQAAHVHLHRPVEPLRAHQIEHGALGGPRFQHS